MCFPLHSAYHADFYFRLRAILLGWSWTALLTKPVMMLACFLRHRNSRLGSAFVMHPNEKRLRTTQENITQLARRMEVENVADPIIRPTQRAPSTGRCKNIVERLLRTSHASRNFTKDLSIMTTT